MLMKNLIRIIFHKFKHKKCKISFSAKVSLDTAIGTGVKILDHSKLGSCKIGNYTYIGSSCSFERTTIGSFCSIGPEVICGMGSHPLDFISTYPGFYSKDASGAESLGTTFHFEEKKSVQIGSDVWIGARAIIMGGVKIGVGSVIAAGAIVTKDVPDFAIVAGVPATVKKYRFKPDIISQISQSKWWNLPIEQLKQASQYSDNPTKFLDVLRKS